MLKGVTCKGCMVCLDVDLEILFKAVLAQEGKNGCGVIVILMLGRLLGLGLDVEIARIALGKWLSIVFPLSLRYS